MSSRITTPNSPMRLEPQCATHICILRRIRCAIPFRGILPPDSSAERSVDWIQAAARISP
jgi:hypothetical protein